MEARESYADCICLDTPLSPWVTHEKSGDLVSPAAMAAAILAPHIFNPTFQAISHKDKTTTAQFFLSKIIIADSIQFSTPGLICS